MLQLPDERPYRNIITKNLCVFATKTGHFTIRFLNRHIYRIFSPSRAHKRLQEKGVVVNLKSLYRLTGSQPLQKIDARIVKPICLVLGVDLSELIPLEKPKLSLLKLDPATQARITGLLDKNSQGTITKRERAELERLVDKAEKISLHNARALVEYRRRRADKAEGTGVNRKRRSGKESEEALLA